MRSKFRGRTGKVALNRKKNNLELLPWLESAIEYIAERKIEKIQVIIDTTKMSMSKTKEDKIKVKLSKAESTERTL